MVISDLFNLHAKFGTDYPNAKLLVRVEKDLITFCLVRKEGRKSYKVTKEFAAFAETVKGDVDKFLIGKLTEG